MASLQTPKHEIENKNLIGTLTGLTPLTIPPSPHMKQLGYGTGVNVYLIERFSPLRGCYKSPWAVKKINSKLQPNSEFKKRLEDEANTLKSLNHPNIIGYRSHMQSEDGSVCLLMESGEQSLADLISLRSEKELGPFPPNNILKVVKSVASALQYLHNECHILHGDLKSDNVLIKGDFEAVKLCDFGVALKLDEDLLVKDNELYVGTECWSAPEVISGNVISHKTDIFSFGLLIWEMIALTAPHLDKLDEESFIANSSLDEETLELLEMKREEQYLQVLGTRPALPSRHYEKSYNEVLELFCLCTEALPSKRPSAKLILTFLGMKSK